jgi:hypothetical protein
MFRRSLRFVGQGAAATLRSRSADLPQQRLSAVGHSADDGPQRARSADRQSCQPIYIGTKNAEIAQASPGAAGGGAGEDGKGGVAETGASETAAHHFGYRTLGEDGKSEFRVLGFPIHID